MTAAFTELHLRLSDLFAAEGAPEAERLADIALTEFGLIAQPILKQLDAQQAALLDLTNAALNVKPALADRVYDRKVAQAYRNLNAAIQRALTVLPIGKFASRSTYG
jgi:hypothetical protein